MSPQPPTYSSSDFMQSDRQRSINNLVLSSFCWKREITASRWLPCTSCMYVPSLGVPVFGILNLLHDTNPNYPLNTLIEIASFLLSLTELSLKFEQCSGCIDSFFWHLSQRGIFSEKWRPQNERTQRHRIVTWYEPIQSYDTKRRHVESIIDNEIVLKL